MIISMVGPIEHVDCLSCNATTASPSVNNCKACKHEGVVRKDGEPTLRTAGQEITKQMFAGRRVS